MDGFDAALGGFGPEWLDFVKDIFFRNHLLIFHKPKLDSLSQTVRSMMSTHFGALVGTRPGKTLDQPVGLRGRPLRRRCSKITQVVGESSIKLVARTSQKARTFATNIFQHHGSRSDSVPGFSEAQDRLGR